MNNGTVRKARRTNEQINKDIMSAMLRLVQEKGFGKITMQALIKEAGIDPNVFYRWYGSMDSLYEAFTDSFDFWLRNKSDIAEIQKVGAEQYYKDMINRLFEETIDDRLMKNYLIWEVSDDSEITTRTAMMREMQYMPLVAYYKNHFKGSGVDINCLTAILVAGIFYMILHKDKATFCSIDLNNEDDRKKFTKTLDFITTSIFSIIEERNKKGQAIKKMLKDGISKQKICEYLGISSADFKAITSLTKDEEEEEEIVAE